MEDFKGISAALGHRIHAIADRDGIAANQIATRFTVERIVDEKNWIAAFGPARIMLKGGLLVDNATRPTKDANVQSVRSYTEDELLNGMRTMKDLLRADGIDIVNARVRYMDVGYGDPLSRLAFEAKTGGIRVNSQVDISSGCGKDAFPAKDDVHRETFPSFATKNFTFPSYTARRQPLESAIAERWIAVALQPAGDYRMKAHADLVLFHSQDDVDLRKVGSEIVRVLRYRGIPHQEFSGGLHDHFCDLQVLKRAAEWDKVRALRPNMRPFEVFDIWASLASTYRGGVLDGYVKARGQVDFAAFIRRREERKLRAAAPVAVPEASNVVAFRR